MLERYNAIIPNGAERIMAMAERQAEHRRSLESKTVEGNLKAQARGQHYALIFLLASLATGGALIALGKSTAGLTTMFVPLASVAAVFVTSRLAQAKERREKLGSLVGSAGNPQG